tara:strand:+ start:907 stop:1206 length:300 start_codon:yes stop_codon:yes gene_type:complete
MNNNIISKKIKIDKMEKNDNYFVINSDNDLYYLPIVNGSVDILVKNYDKEEVGFKYLEVGDKIRFKGYQDNQNKIIIKKIYVETKYIFYSESSEDLELY